MLDRLLQLWHRLLFYTRRDRFDRELEEEMRFHLEMKAEENLAAGISADEAQYAARRQFGNQTLLQEASRDMWSFRFLETLAQDLRYGLRILHKDKGFTIVAVFTLALGIGANTAIFSVVNALLLKPLPYPNPDQLVWITEFYTHPENQYVLASHFSAWKAQSQTLAQIAAYVPDTLTLTGAGETERLDANHVSDRFFALLGAQLLLGRNFLPAEDRPGGEAIISHSLWQRRFNSDRQIIGRSITLNNQGYTVVGVLSPDFRFIHPFEVWTPLALDPAQGQGGIGNAIARLKPGVTREQAQVELETISRRIGTEASAYELFDRMRVISLHERLVGDTQPLLLILLGAVSLILLIACANVANLQLSRAAERQREFAVRSALGARSWRLIRQMLTESWLLALGGGALGLLLAFLLTKAFVAMTPTDMFGDIARLPIDLDLSALVFTSIFSFLTGTLFGLAPAFQFSRPNPPTLNNSLKESGRGHSFQRTRLRQLLMVVEVALAIVLLAGAGLLIRSFVKLLEVDPGYRPDNLLTAQVSPPVLDGQQAGRRNAFYREVLQRVSTLPGVESAGFISHLPLTDYQLQGWLRLPGSPQFLNVDQPAIPLGVVSEGYFRTMGIPLRAGRVFNERDHSEAQRVVILSESLAQSLFPNEDAVGKQVWMPGPGKDLSNVIGIVGDLRHQGLERDVTPQIYIPYMQSELVWAVIVIRTTSDPMRLAAAVRNQTLAVDSGAVVYDVQTMERRLATSMSSRRFNLLLLSIFAFLALTLAAIGVFSVIAHAVTQRTYEIGIRMALGASPGNILRFFVGQGMTVVAVGIALGLAGAWALTRVIANMLFGVSATDPLTFAGCALFLSIIALLACYLPARRATKVDPMTALRSE
ncbi:MAG: ABC transporter permease [Blastocatellia bacterium]|nr:ABC transporter permease [Blastocatellia bacterium]